MTVEEAMNVVYANKEVLLRPVINTMSYAIAPATFVKTVGRLTVCIKENSGFASFKQAGYTTLN